MSKLHKLETQELDNGDLLVICPPELLASMGWGEGTSLDITVDETTGVIHFKKVDVNAG